MHTQRKPVDHTASRLVPTSHATRGQRSHNVIEWREEAASGRRAVAKPEPLPPQSVGSRVFGIALALVILGVAIVYLGKREGLL